MELNGKNDYVARSLHALCAIPLLLFVVFEVILSRSLFGIMLLVRFGLGYGALHIAYRLLKYAITGEDSINRNFEWPFV